MKILRVARQWSRTGSAISRERSLSMACSRDSPAPMTLEHRYDMAEFDGHLASAGLDAATVAAWSSIVRLKEETNHGSVDVPGNAAAAAWNSPAGSDKTVASARAQASNVRKFRTSRGPDAGKQTEAPMPEFAPPQTWRAPADGYTLLLANAANAINATLYDKLNFIFIRDIAPVAGVVSVPMVRASSAHGRSIMLHVVFERLQFLDSRCNWKSCESHVARCSMPYASECNAGGWSPSGSSACSSAQC